MKKDWLNAEVEIRAGIEKFYENCSSAKNINELKNITDELLKIVYKYSSEKNNRPYKSLKIFEQYNKQNTTREHKIKSEITKMQKKTWKDYVPQFFILRKRGMSYQQIAYYTKQKYNIKVSRETIRKVLQTKKTTDK